jgi:hypothetical protein
MFVSSNSSAQSLESSSSSSSSSSESSTATVTDPAKSKNLVNKYITSMPPSFGSSPSHSTTVTMTDPDIFQSLVEKFITTNRPTLYILTPAYGGQMSSDYVKCLLQTVELFSKINFPLKIEFCKNDSLIPRARNNLVARAMNDPECTHILFIDSDILWSPVDILKMILHEKGVVGGVYPLKHYHWDRILPAQSAGRSTYRYESNPYESGIIEQWMEAKNQSQLQGFIENDEIYLQNRLLQYNVNFLGDYLPIQGNLASVRHLATGFLLIDRQVLEAMFLEYPETKYTDDVHFARPGEEKFSYALFDSGCEDGHFLSEDWMFCTRWTRMGGEIFADVSINLSHQGVETYHGSFLSNLVG